MTKHVVTTDMVAHLWAHQSQDHARSGNGNLSFSGRVLTSYYTPIANLIPGANGELVALITTKKYSVTTSHHCSQARSAVRHLRNFSVLFIGERGGRNRIDGSEDMADLHASNIKTYLSEYETLKGKMLRARDWYGDLGAQLTEDVTVIRRYCEAFGLDCPDLQPVSDAQEITRKRAERDAKNSTPEAIAKRERAAKRRKELIVEKFRRGDGPDYWGLSRQHRELLTDEDQHERSVKIALRTADDRAAWRRGERDMFAGQHSSPIMLRVQGDTIRTSRGAEFPVEHAKKAFACVTKCRELGKAFQRSPTAGPQLRLGHFTIDRIEANGDVKAGCHFVEWAEIEFCARELGLLETVNA